MTMKADLLAAAFRLNMHRINGLVRVLSSHDDLKSTAPLASSSGVRADILRSVVVFLHATFEVVLRSHIPKPGRSLSFYSRTDLDKALKASGIDATPFQILYPPLTQMAKRRKRIVHEADLEHGEHRDWSVADDWQLIMWLLAVPAFYHQLRISLGAEHEVSRAALHRLQTAMASHVEFGKQLVSFPVVPPELRLQALQSVLGTLESIASTLQPDLLAPDSKNS